MEPMNPPSWPERDFMPADKWKGYCQAVRDMVNQSTADSDLTPAEKAHVASGRLDLAVSEIKERLHCHWKIAAEVYRKWVEARRADEESL